MSDKSQVFISYAREDVDVAQQLYRDLRQNGVSAWLDTKSLRAGEDWRRAIRSAIKESAFFLALISHHSIEKRGYVQREIKYALEVLKEFPPEKIFVIPVRLEECEPQYEGIQGLNYVDLFRSYSHGFEKILQVVAAGAALSADDINPHDRRIKPSGEPSLFKTAFDRSSNTTRLEIRKRLDTLLTSSARGRRLVENLFLESNLGIDDWNELIVTLEQTDCETYALLQSINRFSAKRLLIGKIVESGNDRSYFSFRSLNYVAQYLIMAGSLSGFGEKEIVTIVEQEVYLSGDARLDLSRYADSNSRLGRDPMWSTFDYYGDLANIDSQESLRDVVIGLGIDKWLQNEILLMFEYKLGGDNPPRLSTFCDLYSSQGWIPEKSVPLPYMEYAWTIPSNALARPQPEIVHRAITLKNVMSARVIGKLFDKA